LSLASSNGILSLPASYLDVVRAGIVLHGLEPSEPERMDARLVEQADLRPIATWKTRVVQERTHAAGEQVGYGSRPALATAARMATLAIGWADGYPAAMSHGGAVLIRGRRCPILSVSANSTVVRVVDDGAFDADDEVVLLGSQGDASITAWEMARISRGSVYRLLAAVPESVPRRWG
jgi:alanine racemase